MQQFYGLRIFKYKFKTRRKPRRVFLLQKILNLVTKKLNPIRKNPLTIEQNKLNHFVNEFNLFLKYVKVGTRLNLIGPRGN